jgi:hypothetical protein
MLIFIFNKTVIKKLISTLYFVIIYFITKENLSRTYNFTYLNKYFK